MKEKIKRDNVFPINLLKWNIDKKELENQVKNYSRLGFFRALRKVSAGLLIFAAIITLLTVIIGWASGKSMVDVILALILAFFVYKGNRVALATAMIYWTFNRIYMLFSSDLSAINVVMNFVFWALFMEVFWQAYQVEKERKKLTRQNESKN